MRRGNVVAALMVLAGALLPGHSPAQNPGAGPRQPVANPRRVVVAAFENQTGEAALAPLGKMAADWITQGLTRTGIVEVADAPTALSVAGEAATAAPTGADLVRLFSRETGAGLVVMGRYYRQADSVEFVAEVVDARSGKAVRAVGPVAAPTATPVQGAERLRQALVGELAVLLDDRLAHFQALERQPPSYDAYREYMDGLVRYLAADTTAVAHFERAFALDSTFYRALLWTAQSTWAERPEAPLERLDSLLTRLEQLRSVLAPAEQHQLDFVRALRAADPRAAYAAARLRRQAAPGSDDALRELALSAYRVQHYREAGELLARLDPDRGLLHDWAPDYWGQMGVIQHVQGDFAGELRSAAELARRRPESNTADFLRVQALAALGRTDEVPSATSRYAERLPGDAIFPYVLASFELAAHGRQPDALALARAGLTRCDGAAPTDQLTAVFFHVNCAILLGFVGRWREADSLLRGVEPPRGLRPDYLSWAGVAAARLGDRARALAIDDSLAHLPMRTVEDTYALFSVEYRRAMIAAALGDREGALRRLSIWHTAGGWNPLILHQELVFLPYFSDPRFKKLLQSEN